MELEKKIISEHVFIFPFSWKLNSAKQPLFLGAQDQMETDSLFQFPNWERSYFTLADDTAYNEYIYFYKPVRAALYSRPDTPVISLQYVHKGVTKESKITFKVAERVYTLQVTKVQLKLYKTGIGLLHIALQNHQYESPEEIAAINSLHKCIYPPVLPLVKAKEKMFPEWIALYLDSNKPIVEEFDVSYKKVPVPIMPLLMTLLGEPFAQVGQQASKRSILIEPVLGNKMFVLCVYQNTALLTSIQNETEGNAALETLLLDKNQGDHVLQFSYLQNEQHFYGISQFSFIDVTREGSDLRMYDQLATLALVQRATLLSFSATIAEISTLSKDTLVPAIQCLYGIYIQFVNQLYFREVTGDVEGSHIYELLSRKLNIVEELKQLDFEMQEVHEFATLIDQANSKAKMDLLTIVGAALVVPTFVTGFFGMNILEDTFYDWWRHKEIALWFNSYFIFPVVMLTIVCFWNTRGTKRGKVMKWTLLSILLISLGITYFFGCGLVAK